MKYYAATEKKSCSCYNLNRTSSILLREMYDKWLKKDDLTYI